MDRLEAWLWVANLRLAKEGSQEALEMLRAENEWRKEQNLPTVEEELQMIVEESELTNEVEKAKQRLRKQN